MANYLSAIKKTLSFEGGFANIPSDPGGMTYRGVSRKAHPNWPGWRVVDSKQPLKHNQIIPELEPDVIAFYKKHYWDKIRLDEVCNDAIAGFVFDTYVHSGGSGIRMLQRAIGVDDDGVVGAKTIHALNQTNIEILKNARIVYVRSLNKPQFMRGWLRRIESF